MSALHAALRLRDIIERRRSDTPAAWLPSTAPAAPAAPAVGPAPAPGGAGDVFTQAVALAQAQIARNTHPTSPDYLLGGHLTGPLAWMRRWKYRRYVTHRYVVGAPGALVEIRLTDGSTITGRYWAHRSADDAIVLCTGIPDEPLVLLTPADVDAVHVLLIGGSASTFHTKPRRRS